MNETPGLKRRIGLGLLTAYGIGVMIGAGIYVLVGLAAAQAGVWAPLAFLVAGIVVLPTALSYGELSTRIPEAAGEAAFIEKAFNSPAAGTVAGLAIALAGVVTAAAVLRGGVGYLSTFVAEPDAWAIPLFGIALVGVAVVGVLESLTLAAIFTVIEVVGLAAVFLAGTTGEASPDWTFAMPPEMTGIGAAAILAFFAFIGFEDIVNMAEETENPSRTLPLSILLALAGTTVVYMGVAFAVVRAVPLAQLAESERPLALVFSASGAVMWLSAIAIVAALNGILAQIVMAARILYGLGRRRAWLAYFHVPHPRFGTPVAATLLIGSLTIGAALLLPVSDLAEFAAILLLTIFVVVNASLVALKRREDAPAFEVPVFVPVTGSLLSLFALAFSIWEMAA